MMFLQFRIFNYMNMGPVRFIPFYQLFFRHDLHQLEYSGVSCLSCIIKDVVHRAHLAWSQFPS
jgi:hypothetical protein